jgi:Lipoxygenase
VPNSAAVGDVAFGWFLLGLYALACFSSVVKVLQLDAGASMLVFAGAVVALLLLRRQMAVYASVTGMAPTDVGELGRWSREHYLRTLFSASVGVLSVLLDVSDPSMLPHGLVQILHGIKTSKVLYGVYMVCVVVVWLRLVSGSDMTIPGCGRVPAPALGVLARSMGIIAGIIFVVGTAASSFDRPCPLNMGEESSLDVDYRTAAKAVVRAIRDDGATRPVPPRMQHEPFHGCVGARFEVNRFLDGKMRHGVFAEPGKSFDAWVRLSSVPADAEGDDRKPNVRGLAFKLLDANPSGDEEAMAVPGEWMGGDVTSQDFVFISAPIFFTGNPQGYPALLENLKAKTLMGLLRALFPTWNPRHWGVRMLFLVEWMRRISDKVDNHLDGRFWSTVPYRLGPEDVVGRPNPMAVKYLLRPCLPESDAAERARDERRLRDRAARKEESVSSHAALRENMARMLDPMNTTAEQGACLEMFVQLQKDACAMPVEDPTVWWDEVASPPVSVGKLRIPPQLFTTKAQDTVCRDLSFNPWRALMAHRPLGGINKARKPAYGVSADYRRAQAGLCHLLPRNDTTDATQIRCRDRPAYLERPLPRRQRPELQDDAQRPHVMPHALEGLGNTRDYQYKDYPYPVHELPRFSTHLPDRDKFTASKWMRIRETYAMFFFDLFTKGAGRMAKAFHAFSHPQDYENLLVLSDPRKDRKTRPVAARVLERWSLDEEFAQASLTGPNPVLMENLRETRTLRQVTERFSEAQLQEVEVYLAKLESEGRIGAACHKHWVRDPPGGRLGALYHSSALFANDFCAVSDLPMRFDRVLYPAFVLFYTECDSTARGGRRLKPLAVQLPLHASCRERGGLPDQKGAPLFLPNEPNQHAWALAKMFAASARGNDHESIRHLLIGHLGHEPVVVALNRQVPLSHPLMQMLEPHLAKTLAINAYGRQVLLGSGRISIFDEVLSPGTMGSLMLMRNAYVSGLAHYNATVPSRSLRAMGFEDVAPDKADTADDILPGFYYRNDAYRLEAILRTAIRSFLQQHYDSDEAVRRDPALRALERELHSPYGARVPGAGFPSRSFQDLVDFTLDVVWTSSGHHSAVNYPQRDYYSMVPATPGMMLREMPLNRSTVTLDYVMSALPREYGARLSISSATTLSIPPVLPSDALGLGLAETHHTLLGDPDVRTAYGPHVFPQLDADLRALDAAIAARDARALADNQPEYLYPFLRPSRVANAANI